MREVTITLYQFDELSEEAKAKAIEHYRNTNCDCAWLRESLASINAFCDHFGVELTHYSIHAQSPLEFDTNATNAAFRGVKFDPTLADYMPTGYTLDCDLWQTYTAAFKATGSAFEAFRAGLAAGFKAWQADLAHQDSDEYITEALDAQGREFYEDGREYTC